MVHFIKIKKPSSRIRKIKIKNLAGSHDNKEFKAQKIILALDFDWSLKH